MSEEPRITASSHPEVAKRHGLTHWDRDRGQWVRPPEPTAQEVEAVDYESWTVPELAGELDRRRDVYKDEADVAGVERVSRTTKDKKPDLIAMLEADDKHPAENGD